MKPDDIERKIAENFATVYREMVESEPPKLNPETILLDTGLDSLGFTVLVSSLEDALGYDPFQISEDACYPVTFGEFIEFYKKNAP